MFWLMVSPQWLRWWFGVGGNKHYLNQCVSGSMAQYGVNGPHWVQLDESTETPTSLVTPVPRSIFRFQVTRWLCFTSGHAINSRPFFSMTIGPPIPEIQFDLASSRSKVPQSAQRPVDSFPQCFTSGHPIDSRPFRSMTIGPPIPGIHCVLDNSRSKVKVKGTLVSVASRWLISFLFHINWTNHS